MDDTVPDSIRSQWVVIGISGVTCGGKTTLANRLKSVLSPAHVFHQDKYFYPDDDPRHVKVEGLDHNNYDILSSLDMEGMLRDVVATMRASETAATVPLAHQRQLPGRRFLIVEGFTVLNYKPINDLCDYRYYIVLEYGECYSRRVLRVYSPADVPGYYELCVWPEHCRYRAEMEKDPRVRMLDGREPKLLEQVMEDLEPLGLQPCLPEP